MRTKKNQLEAEVKANQMGDRGETKFDGEAKKRKTLSLTLHVNEKKVTLMLY